MIAVILAAGVGKRLGPIGGDRIPKCLLSFAGKTLLQRHLESLQRCDVAEVVLVTGYRHELIEAETARLARVPQPRLVHNSDYEQGSMASLWAARQWLTLEQPILLMDADVLYDIRILERLRRSEHTDCFLLDRDYEPGAEPVKLCVRQDRLVEFRKRIDSRLEYDYSGESVGFFRFSPAKARHLATAVHEYIEAGPPDTPHEEAVRDLLLAAPQDFAFEDITGLPWIEIDFPEDLARAEAEILPRLTEGIGNLQ